MTSWDAIRGKIKHAHDEIESAYQKHVVSAVDKVKERPLLNTAVKMALPAIPIIGPTLKELYDNIGGGKGAEEEDKAKQILDFLGKLEQQNKQQFDKIAEDLKTNRQAIIDAINENKIAITDLISKSSEEILNAVYGVQKTAEVTLDKVEAIAGRVERIQKSILEQRPSPSSEYKYPPKPSTFRGESTKIFVGRTQDINTIRNYFEESNLPVSITGEGGIGKSELAYKAMHKCENMFDLIIPVYFESVLTFDSLLLEIAKSLNLPIDEFEKKVPKERRQLIIDSLGQGEFKHPLIYADNYETIAGVLKMEDGSESTSTKEKEDEKDNARKINAFLENLPPNTAVLLTSRERYNLDGERPIRLDGLSEIEGRDLFIKLAKNHFPKGREASDEIKKALEEISEKAGGHPLSIELLARSYRGEGLPKIKEMLVHIGVGVINPKEESERLQSLKSCFEYSFSRLPQTQGHLLPRLVIFNSPFPAGAIEKIFGFEGYSEILLDLYDRSLLRRIDFDDYGDIEGKYRLYHFHPSVRNYLEHEVQEKESSKQQELRKMYDKKFYLYYDKLLKETYFAIGKKDHVLSLERFSVIWQGKDNDFDRAIRLAKDSFLDRLLAGTISSYLGAILYNVGRYDAALEYLNEAVAINDPVDIVRAAGDYRILGNIFEIQRNYDQALSYYNRALQIDHQNNPIGMARDYGNIGNVHLYQGNYDQALKFHMKALEINEQHHSIVGRAENYSDIGTVHSFEGNYDQALSYYNKALAIHEELQDRQNVAVDYSNIGTVHSFEGNYDQALSYYNKALAIHEELQDRLGMAKIYSNIGVAASKDRKVEAIEFFSTGLEILQELEEKNGYHYSLSDEIQSNIAELQNRKEE